MRNHLTRRALVLSMAGLEPRVRRCERVVIDCNA
jgi:hypothetical protein